MTERTSCDCSQCQAACRHMPGMLAPGDIENIARVLDIPCDGDFIRDHFCASDGAKVMAQGQIISIPTIVPRLTETGCVFLKDGMCSVHAVSPYGCRMFNVCDGPEDKEKHDHAGSSCLALIMQSGIHQGTWQMLDHFDCHATPAVERRGNLQTELTALRDMT